MRASRSAHHLGYWRTVVGIAAAVTLAAMVAWDWHSPGDRVDGLNYWTSPASWLATHTVVASVIVTLLLASVAWVLLDHRAMRRDQLIADSTTSIGLAGSVQPLLGIAFTLAWLGQRAPIGDTGCTLDQLRCAQLGRSPLKWTRAPVRRGFWPDAVTAGQLCGTDADAVDECIREVVGTVRDWANLLVASELGRESAYCMQSLRVRLQELQRCIEQDQPDTAQADLDALRAVALFMAVYFEDSSGPLHRRLEIEKALRRPWAQADLQRCAAALSRNIGDATSLPTEERAGGGREMLRALFEYLRSDT